jgi:hypothetical protein
LPELVPNPFEYFNKIWSKKPPKKQKNKNKRKTMPKEKLPSGVLSLCAPKRLDGRGVGKQVVG